MFSSYVVYQQTPSHNIDTKFLFGLFLVILTFILYSFTHIIALLKCYRFEVMVALKQNLELNWLHSQMHHQISHSATSSHFPPIFLSA